MDVVVAFSGVAAEDEFDVGISGDDDAIDAIAQLRWFAVSQVTVPPDDGDAMGISGECGVEPIVGEFVVARVDDDEIAVCDGDEHIVIVVARRREIAFSIPKEVFESRGRERLFEILADIELTQADLEESVVIADRDAVWHADVFDDLMGFARDLLFDLEHAFARCVVRHVACMMEVGGSPRQILIARVGHNRVVYAVWFSIDEKRARGVILRIAREDDRVGSVSGELLNGHEAQSMCRWVDVLGVWDVDFDFDLARVVGRLPDEFCPFLLTALPSHDGDALADARRPLVCDARYPCLGEIVHFEDVIGERVGRIGRFGVVECEFRFAGVLSAFELQIFGRRDKCLVLARAWVANAGAGDAHRRRLRAIGTRFTARRIRFGCTLAAFAAVAHVIRALTSAIDADFAILRAIGTRFTARRIRFGCTLAAFATVAHIIRALASAIDADFAIEHAVCARLPASRIGFGDASVAIAMEHRIWTDTCPIGTHFVS